MLSPSIITKSKGNSCRTVFIRSATSYCGDPPVPMSPIAANLTEPDLSGNLNSSARTQKTIKLTKARMKIRGLRMRSTGLIWLQEKYQEFCRSPGSLPRPEGSDRGPQFGTPPDRAIGEI